MTRVDAVVVGAGIVGCACAEALARAGQRVVLVEAAFAAGGTTASAMGHLVVMDDSPAQLALTAYSRRLWIERASELSGVSEDDACGTLWLATGPDELARLPEKLETHRRWGVEAEIVDPDELRRLEPELRRDLAGALRVPHDRVVYPPGVALWLLERAREAGAEVRESCPVDAIEDGVVRCAGERLAGSAIVNAAGVDAVRLTPGLPIQPRKGHLVITERRPGFCRHELVELGYLASAHGHAASSVAFNAQPRRTGQLLIGSSRQYAGRDASLDPEIRGRMLERASHFLPRLGELQVLRTWVGFRPATPDSLPLIGRAPDGSWVAAGHEGLGITTSLGTAQLLADMIRGEQPAIDPLPYSPTRAFAA